MITIPGGLSPKRSVTITIRKPNLLRQQTAPDVSRCSTRRRCALQRDSKDEHRREKTEQALLYGKHLDVVRRSPGSSELA